MLARVLAGLAIAWPLVAGTAVWQRVEAPSGRTTLASVVYAMASRICHQRPERSFHSGDVAWPVCARCTGLYVAAPFAVLMAFRRRLRLTIRFEPVWLVFVAAIPTALTLLWEWGGLGPSSNLARFATALPLGAAITVVLIGVASDKLTGDGRPA